MKRRNKYDPNPDSQIVEDPSEMSDIVPVNEEDGPKEKVKNP